MTEQELDQWALQVRKGYLEKLDLKDPRVRKVCLEWAERQDPKDYQVYQGPKVSKDLLDLLDPPDLA